MRTDLNACRLSVNDTLSVVKDIFAQYFWSLQKIVVENPRFPNNQVYRHTHTHTDRVKIVVDTSLPTILPSKLELLVEKLEDIGLMCQRQSRGVLVLLNFCKILVSARFC